MIPLQHGRLSYADRRHVMLGLKCWIASGCLLKRGILVTLKPHSSKAWRCSLCLFAGLT